MIKKAHSSYKTLSYITIACLRERAASTIRSLGQTEAERVG
jgi:hypothetical protein